MKHKKLNHIGVPGGRLQLQSPKIHPLLHACFEEGPGSRPLNTNGQLISACMQNDLDAVRFLVEEARADVEARDDGGRTPLATAVQYFSFNALQYLLFTAKANVEARFPFFEFSESNKASRMHSSWTALILAARIQNIIACRLLVYARADFEAGDSEGFTPLIVASQHGSKSVVRYLLSEARASTESADAGGHTPFAHACINEEFEVIRDLLEAKALVDSRSVSGTSSLVRAVRNGSLELIRFLLFEAKANPGACDNNGNSVLATAAYENNAEAIRLLVRKTVDLESKDKNGRTPLMRAVEQSQIGAIRALAEAKAQVAAKANKGRTCLMEAARRNHLECASVLIFEMGAKVNETDCDERTALVYASDEGHSAMVWMLLQARADVSRRPIENGHTAWTLVYAIKEAAPCELTYVCSVGIDVGFTQGAS